MKKRNSMKTMKKAVAQLLAVSLALGMTPVIGMTAETETRVETEAAGTETVETGAETEAAETGAETEVAETGTETEAAAEESGLDGFVEEFQEPTKTSEANIRYWLKGSFIDEELVAQDMKAIADAGFSTVEIINKGGSTKDLSEYGWGTEEWQKASEIIVREAEANGLSVDFTIGPTWPAAIPTLDANDEAASQQLVYSSQEISASDFTSEDGVLKYSCAISAGPESETEQKLVAVVFGKLTGEQRTETETYYAPPSGTPQDVEFDVQILDEDSLTVVTPAEDGTVNLEIPEGSEGTYILFTFYSQGTGQTVSGSTDPDAVCIDHYSIAGTEALLNYWEENILDDTLREHFQEYGGDLFEDSLELTQNITAWTPDLLELFQENRGYDLAKYLPMLINRNYSATNEMHLGDGEEQDNAVHCYGLADSADKKIVEDYNELMDTLYEENHLKVINEWAKELGLNYRVQAYSGYDTGHYDSNEAAAVVGTIEGESLAFMESHDGLDSFRILSGGAHMTGKQIISDELGAVFFGTYAVTFDDLAELVNLNAAGGANQFVLHGYPGSSETEEETWPGYHPFGTMFSEPWDDRQPVWDSMDIMSDYMARTQNALQEGIAKMDVAIFRDEKTVKTKYFDSDVLTVNGYSYEFLSDDTLLMDEAVVEDGVLTPDSAAYKALVLYQESKLSNEMAAQLNTFAENGLTIVMIGEAPSQGKYFTDSDETLASEMEQLLSRENVYQIETADELADTLKNAGITPAVNFEKQSEVHTLHRSSESTDYYWLYNYGEDDIELSADYVGSGIVYQMNLWTGEIAKLASTVSEDGRIHMEIPMDAGEATVLMITEEEVVGAEEKAETKDVSAVLLKDSDWKLNVESYTATEEGSPETTMTAISKELAGLEGWSDIEGLEIVSGKGTYETQFEIDSLEGVNKAELCMKIGDGTVAITGVYVNGQDAGVVDQSKNTVDITEYLTEGSNTIQIKVATTLANAVNGNSGSVYGLLDAEIVMSK